MMSIQLSGCAVAAIGMGIAAVKWGNAKKREAQAKCDEAYNNYIDVIAKTKQKPMTRDQYCYRTPPSKQKHKAPF